MFFLHLYPEENPMVRNKIKMLQISQLKLHIGHSPEDLRRAIIRKLRISDAGLLDFTIRKKSSDFRDKQNLRIVYTIDVHVKNEKDVLCKLRDPHITISDTPSYVFPAPGSLQMKHRPVIIGSGPAGLFAAYFLAGRGYMPIVIERGKKAEERMQSVRMFWETGVLDPECNIQFGEGGAGTFSDGKLNTGIRDAHGRKDLMLRVFHHHGGPEEILYDHKPHLGTDILIKIITSMRQQIIEWGGEFRFSSLFREFIIDENHVSGVRIQNLAVSDSTQTDYNLSADCVILAVGHSARDTFEYLIRRSPLTVTAKPFAVGIRAEHLQTQINLAQYGDIPEGLLPPADYKLTCHTASGRSVFSFCMCPGGYVVNASSKEGYQCVNGMSYSGRNSKNANSAIIAAVDPSDDPEENIRFQMELERKAWNAGHGKIVSQRFEDFEMNKVSQDYGFVTPVHKGLTVLGDIHDILPADICHDIIEAMHLFGRRIHGFDDPDVLLSAVESRTSSPVRIQRNEFMESPVSGIYPVGEGAGYAGGITSAAIDGIKAFERIAGKYTPLCDAFVQHPIL